MLKNSSNSKNKQVKTQSKITHTKELSQDDIQAIKSYSLHLQNEGALLEDLQLGQDGKTFRFVQAMNSNKVLSFDDICDILHLKMDKIIYSPFGSNFNKVKSVDFEYIKDYIINSKSQVPKDEFEIYIDSKLLNPQDELKKIQLLNEVNYSEAYGTSNEDIMKWLVDEVGTYLNHLAQIKNVSDNFNLGDFTFNENNNTEFRTDIQAMKQDLVKDENSLIKQRLQWILYLIQGVRPTLTYDYFIGRIELNGEHDFSIERVWNMLLEFDELR